MPKLGELAASKLPSRIPVGNPNTPAYNVGGAAASVASLALPIGDGGDAALGITGLLDRTAPEGASAITAAPERLALPPGGPSTVFRADTRGPADIFSGGFQAKGSNMDLWAHVNLNPSGWGSSDIVSTTKSWASAQDFAALIRANYIYEARASGLDVNAIFGARSPFPWENEISVPNLVSPSDIRGAWGPGGWIPNPGYVP